MFQTDQSLGDYFRRKIDEMKNRTAFNLYLYLRNKIDKVFKHNAVGLHW